MWSPCFSSALLGGKKGRDQSSSSTLLEALAKAIDGADEGEAVRLAAEFNNAFGHLVRASVEAESQQGDENENLLVPDSQVNATPYTKHPTHREKKRAEVLERITEEDSRDNNLPNTEQAIGITPKRSKHPAPTSSEDSDVKKHSGRRSRKKTQKKEALQRLGPSI